ncbi:MAG: P-loop NTPase, partial [Actinomycetota bacterium]|nr:P-loop NTPase [Actinomycetota bacterium]
MTTIVEHDATVARRFADAAGPAEVLKSMEQVKVHLSNRPQEFVLILGPSIPLSAATALADTLRVTRPTIGVILVRPEVDTGVLAEALRSGMREVVPQDDLSGLGLAVKRSRGLHDALLTAIPSQAPPEPEGRVISVFSAKGGVGKTTIATNLAVALAD